MPNLSDYPNLIYHFTKSETALLYILPHLRLKLSSFLDANDPKESKTFGFWSIFQGCTDYEILILKVEFEKFLRKNCKQICFSRNYLIGNSDILICGANHPAMWAHYGENSKGICLGIDKDQFQEENPGIMLKSVDYKELLKFPPVDYTKWQKGGNDYFAAYLTENSDALFYSKYFHWRHEDESKCIEIGNQEYCTIENSLKFIFVGAEFDLNLDKVLDPFITGGVQAEKIDIENGRFRTLPYFPK